MVTEEMLVVVKMMADTFPIISYGWNIFTE